MYFLTIYDCLLLTIGIIVGKTKMLPDKSIQYFCMLFNDFAVIKLEFVLTQNLFLSLCF